MGGARWGGDTAGAYYGSQSAHSFFAQQLRALQKMPLPGLHFPLPSWTDLSSSTHVALVVGFRAPTIAVPTSRSLIACLILVDSVGNGPGGACAPYR